MFEDGEWYNATVVKDLGDGGFEVSWDDPDGGPETSVCNAEEMRLVEVDEDYAQGDWVEAMFDLDQIWYPGVVEEAFGNKTFLVRWDDPDGGPETSVCAPRYMKHHSVYYCDYQVGDRVDARSSSGEVRPAFIGDIHADGSFDVQWETDSEEGRFRCWAEDLKGVRRDYGVGDRVEALYPGTWEWQTGVVRRRLEFGAFEIRWDQPGAGPASSMSTPEEMSPLQDLDEEDWFSEDLDEEYEGDESDNFPPEEAASSKITSCAKPDPSCQRSRVPSEILLAQYVRLPEVQCLCFHPTTTALQMVFWRGRPTHPSRSWTVANGPQLTLNPRQRGHRRNWRQRQVSKLLGSTVIRLIPSRHLVQRFASRAKTAAAGRDSVWARWLRAHGMLVAWTRCKTVAVALRCCRFVGTAGIFQRT
ncbi:unnamed protein product [Symbiodinium pilosum]|uniref:Uncharacterized protein n=1 Tax=Symbiodinium pilosum TaxID=2952 RepID=A0A812M8Y1_SYMPI|nr:unnamed protein product [Symbiodinium pilosum]